MVQSLPSIKVQSNLYKSTSSSNSKYGSKLPLRDHGFSELHESYKNQENPHFNNMNIGDTFGEIFSLYGDSYRTTRTRPKTTGMRGKSLIDFDPLLKKNKASENNENLTANSIVKKIYNFHNHDYNGDLRSIISSQVLVNYHPKPLANNNYYNIKEKQKQNQHTIDDKKIDKSYSNKKNQTKHRRIRSSPLPEIFYEPLRNNNDDNNENKQKYDNQRKTKSASLYLSFDDSILHGKTVSSIHNKTLGDKTSSTSAVVLSSLAAKPRPTSFLTGKEKNFTTTNAVGHLVFKLEIPPLEEFIFNSRLCQFMDDYRKNGVQEIDLHDTLAGVPRLHLQTFLSIGKLPSSALDNQRLIRDTYRPIIQSLLKCANDIQLSYHTTEEEEQHQQLTMNSCSRRRSMGSSNSSSYSSISSSSSSKISNPVAGHIRNRGCSEVAIFQCQRQFVVVFRGTPLQKKGGVAALFSKTNTYKKSKKTLVPFPTSSSVGSSLDDPKIYSCFRDTYMRMENRVIKHLDNLIEENPFCDVVFTGHSFGGALAQIAAVRYATARSVIRVSCHVFSSPKVGNIGFVNLANQSLPNLKVVRMEYTNDHIYQVPTSTTKRNTSYNRDEGCHIGHLVAINKSTISSNSNSITSNNKGNQNKIYEKSRKQKKESFIVRAYKFNKSNSTKNSSRKSLHTLIKKRNCCMEEYVNALEKIKKNGIAWPEDFEGENIGEGVKGSNNESRKLS